MFGMEESVSLWIKSGKRSENMQGRRTAGWVEEMDDKSMYNLNECLEYFQGKRCFLLLFKKIREKYRSLGHFGGSVTLSGLNREEKEQLGGFLQKNLVGNKTVTVSAELMKKALENSRFSKLSWEAILEAYFDDPLIGKKEEHDRFLKARQDFFDEFEKETPGGRWLLYVREEKGDGYQILMQNYRENKKMLKEALEAVLKASSQLPVYEERTRKVALFAAEVTGNPHFFDEGTLGERLISAFIRWNFNVPGISELSRAEWKSSLLLRAGILKDDISSYTTAYGIHGRKKDGKIHEGIEGFYWEEEPVQLSLLTLSGLTDVWAGECSAYKTQRPVVYVVENPSVFSALISIGQPVSVICGNGQPRLATLVLLDLVSKNADILYGGDFDPEGLAIAQNLKHRYGEKLRFWMYGKQYYELAVSEVKLPKTRLKKLERIKEAGLLEVQNEIMEKERAAYQERLVELYIQYVRKR